MLAEACRGLIRLLESVGGEVIRDGLAPSLVLAGRSIEADAVIRTVLATKVPELIPLHAGGIRTALANVTYPSGGREWP